MFLLQLYIVLKVQTFIALKTGQTGTMSVSCLINSIARFIHLVSCLPLRTMPTQKDYRNITNSLKRLKLVLDNVIDSKVSSDEMFSKECKELDIAVNEARDFIENWSPKMSKIRCVSTFFLFNMESDAVNDKF